MTAPDAEPTPDDKPVSPEALAAGQRTLAAIVFTDTVGFSALMRKDEERALRLVARDMDQMKETCVAFSGQVLKGTGDGLLMLFTSAVQAVACALEIQRNFLQASVNLPKNERLQHRIGIHLGDIFLNGNDVMGDGVNIAARLQTEAVPGGICLSKTVYDVVANRLQFYVNDLGARKLKNIGTVTAYQISPLVDGVKPHGISWYRVRAFFSTGRLFFILLIVGVFWLGAHREWAAHNVGKPGAFTLIPVKPAPKPAVAAPPAAPVSAGTAPAPTLPANGELKMVSTQEFEMARFDNMRKYDFEEMRDWIAGHDWPEKATNTLDEQCLQMQHLLRWLQEGLHSYSASNPLIVTGPHGKKTEFWTISFGGLKMKDEGMTMTVMREQIPPRMIMEIIEELMKERPETEDQQAHVEQELETFKKYYNVKPSAAGTRNRAGKAMSKETLSPRQIGLTGGIACGKSTFAEGLRARGWHVIDTDQIAHRLMQPGGANWKNVVDAFGVSVLQPDQSIDRKVLGRLVFADPLLRIKLNEITHPAIRSVWQRERDERARTHPTYSLAVMIPLLFECELEQMFSAVWCIGASRTVQVKRLKARGLSGADAALRIDSQMPVATKMARANIAFWGEGTPDTLLLQLDRVSNT